MGPARIDLQEPIDMEVPPALQDLGALWLAGSAEEFWKALVLSGGLPASWNHWDAGLLLRRHHGEGQPGALDSALLLCTDSRWRRATAGLIAEIASSGLLGDDELTALAERFLDDTVVWQAPAAWTDGGWVDIILSGPEDPIEDPIEDDDVEPVEDDPPAGPLQVRRAVQPPLRRWAAAELVRRYPERLAVVFGRTRALSARDAAALVAGILDACDALDDQLARRMVEIGLGWPAGSVRLVALERLAGYEGLDAARRLAAEDTDAKVRQWAQRPDSRAERATAGATSDSGEPQPRAGSPSGARRAASARREPDPDTQPSLFDL